MIKEARVEDSIEEIVEDSIEERLSQGKNLVFAIQHVLVMIAGAMVVPMIIGGAAGIKGNEIQYIVSCALLAAGIATFIQSFGINDFAGARIPVIEATSFASVSTMCAIAAGKGTLGMQEIAGSVIVAGLFCFGMASVWGKLLRFFPKVVTGTVVTVIGFSLFPVGIGWITKQKSTPKVSDIWLALATLIIILLCNKFLEGILRNLSIVFGLIGGTIIAIFTGQANFLNVSKASWVGIITPFHFGAPIFNVASSLSFILVMLVIMTEATGNMIAVHNMAGRKVEPSALSRGLRSNGLSTIISACFNSYPVTPFAQNVGMLSLTGVYSRFVTMTSGIILVILAFFPKFAAIFASIPGAVLGGASFAMFGIVAVSGIRTLGTVNYVGNQNAIIVAVSLGLSMIPNIYPAFFAGLPVAADRLLSSGITIGCASIILLNIFFNIFLVPKDQREEVSH